MTNRRARAMATATVLGLGALGGVALGSNPGMPGAVLQKSGAVASTGVSTGASGAAALPGEAAATAPSGTASRTPIVTRASGAGGVPRDD
jgi:hypothetical protein